MPYSEGSAYITDAAWRGFMGATIVSDLTEDDADVSLNFRSVASGIVDEFATTAGLTLPLGGAHLTYAMKRRVAIIAAHLCASDRKPEYRDAQGRGPYHDGHDRALAELKDWVQGVRSMPADRTVERESFFAVSNPRRRWIR